jgi:hypothetical protein
MLAQVDHKADRVYRLAHESTGTHWEQQATDELCAAIDKARRDLEQHVAELERRHQDDVAIERLFRAALERISYALRLPGSPDLGIDVPDAVSGLVVSAADATERAELLYDQLYGLLALIHRDGGHYTNEHGIDTSVSVAERIVVQIQSASAPLSHRDPLSLARRDAERGR